MYEVTCWAGLPCKFLSLKSAIRYAIELQDGGVRRVSVWDLGNADLSLRGVRAFLEARSDLMGQIRAIEDGRLCSPDRETAIAELWRRVAELDGFLVQA
jgi:hypothetical protein